MYSTKKDEREKIYRVLELFSGIGSMRCAIQRSGRLFELIAAIDIDPVANSIYNHNFGSDTAKNENILGLTAKCIAKLDIEVILMAPPSQLLSCNGAKRFARNAGDHRGNPFVHICNMLDKLHTVQFIVMENSKSFVRSQARKLYKRRLSAAGFHYKEYVLSPDDFGVPNTRRRYYCVARRTPFDTPTGSIVRQPNVNHVVPLKTIGEIVEREGEHLDKYLINLRVLRKRLRVIDVCTPDSTNSRCFTKSYTRHTGGTGSIYSPLLRVDFDSEYRDMRCAECDEHRMFFLKRLKMRYFSPREIARLMCFPENLSFPSEVTDEQCYQILGNSPNVLVLSSLIDEIE
ncbi:tRNA (cytosine(38)-C(5))-methyltransferase-like [Toxorhynchites rutilus septentrionalis]|uniref:tRNA (cytosine(38)-C(5))-methyltransferase-like n=1 Tax=Toxorhynchites rutilus septentrionalis TaxID=329112 RepID=UPI002479026E|nr:tRNA (cytosine(38)-C(5))-methyltransferase-like [Toxorhynchites rutilus septentrionalis]